MKNTLRIIPAALLCFSASSQAALVITMLEVGGDVVIEATGSIDTVNGLQPRFLQGYNGPRAVIAPATPFLGQSEGILGNAWTYPGMTGPSNYGVDVGEWLATEDNYGDTFYLIDANSFGGLPEDVTFPHPISFTAVYRDKSLNDLGARVGAYLWTWGTAQDGVNGDSIRLCVGIPAPCAIPAPPTATPVPTLGAFGLIGLAGVIGAAGVAMTRRRKK